ncbi:MAG: hypothetical protein HC794_05990 [Nitrospiraceae bacterium]|nr:hypothetical protein [Nitrospiraceae bacterium]
MSSQHAFADCGYVCISILLAHFKKSSPVHAIKAFVGSTERGLTLSQLQSALQKVGAATSAIAFDRHRASAPSHRPTNGRIRQPRSLRIREITQCCLCLDRMRSIGTPNTSTASCA